jgi:chromosome segregation ATPase
MADKSIPQRLQEELTNLQSVVDEVKLQMHLGSKEIQDKLQPHLEELEQELSQLSVHSKLLEKVGYFSYTQPHLSVFHHASLSFL